MFLKSCRWRASVYSALQIAVSGMPSGVDVLAKPRRRHRPGRVVEQVAARLDLGDVLLPGLRIHRDHEVDAAAPAAPAVARRRAPRTTSAGPGCSTGRCCARPPARPCAGWRLREQAVRRRRARAVDVGELDDEVVDARELSVHVVSRAGTLQPTDCTPAGGSGRASVGVINPPPSVAAARVLDAAPIVRLRRCRAGTSACPTHQSGSARRTGRNAGTRPRPSPSRARS